MDNHLSAREYRAVTQDSQTASSQLQILHQITAQLNKVGAVESTMQKILELICSFTNTEHGFIATEMAGTYKIKASIGSALGVGIRVPASTITDISLSALSSIHQSKQVNRLWNTAQIQTEWIIPIKIAMQVNGFIALASSQQLTLFNEQEEQFLNTVATIIGLCATNTNSKVSQESMMSVALLTPREKEVFKLLPSGLTNAEIGEKLGIATGTAKIHVERILSKLALGDRTQAAVRANELGYHID